MVKDGYILTEIGIIPKDWQLLTVNDTLELLTDFEANGSFESVANNVTISDNSNFAWYVRATDLEKNSNLSNVKYVDKKSYSFLKKTPLFGKEVLITKRGEIGKVYYFKQKYSHSTLAPNLYLLKLNQNIVEPLFVYYFFKSNIGNKLLLQKNASSTLGALYKDDVKAIYFPIPPIEEQKAIAKALSDTDELIITLEKLILKKEAIKQGTMQQLLTGRKRLSGFSGEWKEKRLEEISNISRGASPRPIEDSKWFDSNSSIGWVRISDISKTTKFLNYTVQKLSEDGVSQSRFVKKDNLIMSICATLGKPILTKIDSCIHDGFVVFNNLQIDREFLYYFLFFIENNWSKSGQTGSQMNLNTELINSTTILLPPTREEQLSIAKILSDMDKEIETLKSKLTKTKAIKDGIMSELLTGKTRLKVKDE
ncbi:MAG: restriction endonuclease subunit S [Aliarcobacter sp.]|jgi:type I restriction enzyme S subunit|nr:restriction endonuclease subunit S [Aliarcobacter sp.]